MCGVAESEVDGGHSRSDAMDKKREGTLGDKISGWKWTERI